MALSRWALVCVTVLFAVLTGGGAVAAPEPEEPAPAPTTQPEPEELPSPTATLIVYTTVLTEQPRSGSAVKAQVWVAATGALAANVTLVLDAGANATLTPQCTLAVAADTTCRLGTLDAQGVTIPLTLQTPRNATARTIALTATAAAAPALPAQLTTTIALAPVAAPAPKPTKTTPSPKPTKTTRSPQPVNTTPAPQQTSTPTIPVVPPPVPATVPTAPNPTPYTPTSPSPAATLSSPPILPQIVPDPINTFPNGNTVIAPPAPSPTPTLHLTPVSSTLTTAHGLWLGALLTAIIATLLLARRTRGRRLALAGRRRKTKSQSGHRRYTPQGSRSFDEQTAHDELAEFPTAISEPPAWPMKTGANAKGAEEIESIHESLQYFKAISMAFNEETGTGGVARTRTDWHASPIKVETISTPHLPRTEPDISPAVQARSLSWIRAITKRSPGNNGREFNESSSETRGPEGVLGPSPVWWAD